MGKVTILSRSYQGFTNRKEAGRLLAKELTHLKGTNPVILGIPRGGVVIAAEIRKVIGGDLDVILAHKIGAPGHAELAIGSIAENGSTYIDTDFVRRFGITVSYIQQQRIRELAEIKRRSSMIRNVRLKIPLENRTVIITDDGVATGATTMAAAWAVKVEQPERIIGAFPVGSESTISMLGEAMDELICLNTPPGFSAVGQFYQHFYQVTDSEVIDLLTQSGTRAGTA